ncbi:MAG: L-threonylcarbamoyladenylate synthase [Patescibacteria group bacterium]|jgi:L-threonylcarbamoyladenylate synthase
MKEIKLNKNNKIKVLQEAMEVLNRGGIIIYPTETSYGMGCDFYDKKACNKIYKIKKRNKKNPLSVLIPDMITANSLVRFSEKAKRLASHYWPGPLTLVLPYKYYKIQEHGDDYLALRVSDHVFAMDLVTNFAKPIVATSANISNNPSCYTAAEIYKQLKDSKIQPDLFINAGRLPRRNASTIIKFVDDKGEILRQGDIKISLD